MSAERGRGDPGPGDAGPDNPGPDNPGPDDPGPDDPGPDDPGPDDPGPDDEVEESMAGFRRKAGAVSARFTAAQAGIVRDLVAQVAELVGGGAGGGKQDAGAQGSWPGAVPAPGHAEDSGSSGEGPAGDFPFSDEDLAGLLGGEGPTTAPEDPVLARLFPDAYTSDPEAAGEFRRFTEQGLRSAKVAAARTVLATLPESGGRVRLSDSDAQAWLRALNDVRLALGVRLGITEDFQEQVGRISRDDPRAAYVYIYDWLTFLQETLVRALR